MKKRDAHQIQVGPQRTISSFFARSSAPTPSTPTATATAVAGRHTELSPEDEVSSPSRSSKRRRTDAVEVITTSDDEAEPDKEQRREKHADEDEEVTMETNEDVLMSSSAPLIAAKQTKHHRGGAIPQYAYQPHRATDGAPSQATLQKRATFAAKSSFRTSYPATMAEKAAKESVPVQPDLQRFQQQQAQTGQLFSKKSSLTPLEQQIVQLKLAHPGMLLVVEVGYKYRLFGEDAQVASKVLNIFAYQDHAFLTSSFPVVRLMVHVRRLVQAGYKVGVVRQIETAALKSIGDNKSAPFTREVKEIFTKGTLLEDSDSLETGAEDAGTGFLLCYSEENVQPSSDEKIRCSLIAVQLSTGDVVFDTFEDGLVRSELETRMQHLNPSEILIPNMTLSKPTEKLFRTYTIKSTTDRSGARLEKANVPLVGKESALSECLSFYQDLVSAGSKQITDKSNPIGQLVRWSPALLGTLALLISHLKDFGLAHVLANTARFQPFASLAYMQLPGKTTQNLSLFSSSEEKNVTPTSLLSFLDHTVTAFGKRLLRKWLSQPLLNREYLDARRAALDELLTNAAGLPYFDLLQQHLKNAIDLEKSLSRIQYGKAGTTEIYGFLTFFANLQLQLDQSNWPGAITSTILRDIFRSIVEVQEAVSHLLTSIDATAAKENDRLNLLADDARWTEPAALKEGIQSVQAEIQAHLKEVRKVLGTQVQYASIGGVDYQIEVPVKLTNKVPRDWTRITAVKLYGRYHTPFVIKKMHEREVLREKLQMATDAAIAEYLQDFAEHHSAFRDVIGHLAAFDCLQSLKYVAQLPGYVNPTLSEKMEVSVRNGRHPLGDLTHDYIANDIKLHEDGTTCLIVTGPNMGGKSSYIRQTATILILAQIGSYVPAEAATVGLFDGIYARMGASDDIARGASTFMMELGETSEILQRATSRSLVILDELGRGTSTHDGMAIAHATLCHLVQVTQCVTLFVTHYPALCSIPQELSKETAIRNVHMGFLEDGDDVVFLYKVTEGVATRSYGLNVARLARLPASVLDEAAVASKEIEMAIRAKEVLANNTARDIRFFMGAPTREAWLQRKQSLIEDQMQM